MKRTPMPPRKKPMRRSGMTRRRGPKRHRTATEKHTYAANRRERALMAGYECEAIGLHHPDCPGRAGGHDTGAFVTHHVHPRAEGGADDVGNLRFVWNGLTPFGAGGCHGRIHTETRRAIALGLLTKQER